MELTWVFRKEEGEFERESGAGQFERQTYRGIDLRGQVKVRVKRVPGMDSAILVKEGTAEALQMKLYRADGQPAINKLLENMNLPTNVNEEQAIQVRRAEQAWIHFSKTKEVESIDPSIDDHQIWWQILGKRWQGEENLQGLKALGWSDKILPSIAGWEIRLQRAEEMDLMQRAIYEGIPPDQWEAKYLEGEALQKAMVAAQNEQAKLAGMPPQPPPPPLPRPPEDGQFLPDATELKIYMLWQADLMGKALTEEEQQETGQAGGLVTEELVPYLRMKARMEAHKLLNEAKQREALAGPETAAPGGAQSQAGQQPTEAAPGQLPAGAAETGPDDGVR